MASAKKPETVSGHIQGFGALILPEAGGPDSQPKERLVSVGAAKAAIKSVVDSDEHQARLNGFQAVADAYERMPPDSESDLEFDGFKGLANVDWGGMQAGIDDQAEIYLNLALEPDKFCAFKSRAKGPHVGKGLLDLSERHAKMMRQWEEIEIEFSMMTHNMAANGLGILHWPMPHSWHCQNLHPANLIVPKKAALNSKKWPWCAIVTRFEIQNLIPKLDPEVVEDAKSQGWDTEVIRDAINAFRAAQGSKMDEKLDIDQLISRFVADGPGSIDESDGIAGFIYYVREWDGTISEYWISDQESVDKPLYKRRGRYRDMTQVIALFPAGLGDGHLMRIRGFGINSLPFHDLENRHLNRTIDAAWLAASIGLKGDPEMLDRLSELIIGPIFNVPDDFTVEQVAFQNQTKTLVEIGQLFDQKKASRSQSMGGPIDVSPNADRTATGARLRYQEQTGARSGAISRFYRQLSMFWKTMWFRIADPGASETDPGYFESRQMLEDALREGLPVEALATIDEVVAKRVFGDGDPNNLFLALSDLVGFLGRLSPSGQRFFIRHLFNARLRNAPEVDAMLVEPEQDDELQRQQQIAQGENADFETSNVAISVASSDNHGIHAGEHLLFAEDKITQFENKRIELEDAYLSISRVREHVLPHMQALQQDELSEPIFREYNNRFAGIDNAIKRYGQMLQAKREAEQADQLEQIKSPRPTVDQLAKVETEGLKQQLEKQRAAKLGVQDDEKHRATMRKLEIEERMARNAAEGKVTDQKDFSAAQSG